jgi:hypothetical protein
MYMPTILSRTESLLTRPVRPTTSEITRLLNDGLTDQIIIAAGEACGLQPPHMEETLRDVGVVNPYLHLISDRLAEQPERHKIFAGRDGDYMADNYLTRYPNLPATLLPASGVLFADIYTRTQNGDPLVPLFLNAHRLGRRALRQLHDLVDTGYKGTIGKDVDEMLCNFYSIPSLRDSGALATKLVCHMEEFPGLLHRPNVTEILKPEDLPHEIRTGNAFARFGNAVGFGNWTEEHAACLPSYPLATILQGLPHFTGPYGTLAEVDGRATAISRDTLSPTVYVDRVGGVGANPNTRSPVAATIIQAHVIRAALETV